MKPIILPSLLAFCCAVVAEDLPLTPMFPVIEAPVSTESTAPATIAPRETYMGVLHARVAIGGESTGWALTVAGGRVIDLELTPQELKRARDGASVTVIGVIETRRYAERGDVSVLVVSDLQEAER